MHRTSERGEKDGFWSITDLPILSYKRKMKVRKGTQGNKQKDHQADDGANEEKGEEGKRARKTCSAEKKKAMESWGTLHAGGRRVGFQVRCLSAI